MTTLQHLPANWEDPTVARFTERADRAEQREALSNTTFDLLVIGGGILGISTAWHAAQSGLRVALVDSGDFAGATSSASSKLLHGGLRYLQTGAVKLVAENHFERRAVTRQVAPHLSRPLTFYLPIYKNGPHGAAKMGAGVFAYSALSAFGDGVGHLLNPVKARMAVPELRTDDLKAVAVYGDSQMNDARMALMTVRAAADAGAVVLNHAEVTGLRFTGRQGQRKRVSGADLRDRTDGTEFGVNAHVVLNATGPWVDHLRRMEDAGSDPRSASPRAPTSSSSAPPTGRPRWRRRSTSTASPSRCRGRTCSCSAPPTRSTRATPRTWPSTRRTSARSSTRPGTRSARTSSTATSSRTPSPACGSCPAAPGAPRRPSARPS
nr:hypothetical protein GCM10025732_42720 [Glycomyces mayteni]